MSDGIKIEWEEPGPADKCRLTVSKSYSWRDPTEFDLTHALELLAPEVRGRVIAKWRMRVDSQEAAEEIRDLKNRLALSDRQVTIATALAYVAHSPDATVAAMREMPADVLERVLAPFAHEKGKLLVERRAAEVRAEKAERMAFEQQLALDDLRAELAAAREAADSRPLRYTRHRPKPPERTFRDYDEDGEPCVAERTDAEMLRLWAQYGADVEAWATYHWSAVAKEAK